jgi:hypothetical protein
MSGTYPRVTAGTMDLILKNPKKRGETACVHCVATAKNKRAFIYMQYNNYDLLFSLFAYYDVLQLI